MTLFKNAYQYFEKVTASDHSKQVTNLYYFKHRVDLKKVQHVVDLGCGKGDSFDFFKARNPNIYWVGIDIESSPEVEQRERKDAEFKSFDGIHIPLEDNSQDIVYSNQVFEHVRYPRELLKEVRRVLRPGGHFIGSTSHLEPYHSYSYWNYTPYGFKQLIEETGMTLIELKAGIDGPTLTFRKLIGAPKFMNFFFNHESPLNILFSLYGFLSRRSHKEINLLKLMFCGTFSFFIKK